MKKEKGITLIALVVTIVIILILAGVTLNLALGDGGLIKSVKKASEAYNRKEIQEKLQLLYMKKEIENSANRSNTNTGITSLLEEMVGSKEITEEDIEEFNSYLEQYGEKVIAISSAEELEKIGKDEETEYPLDGIYIQLADIINVSTTIGTKDAPFIGVYNGNGKKVQQLDITANKDNTGMFGVSAGTIKNVTIESCTITSNYMKVGAIAGKNTGLIENCTITSGTISSTNQISSDEGAKGSRIGGICGENTDGGIIRNCNNYSNVSGEYRGVGGICGIDMNGTIENCINNGTIEGRSGVGGIIGTTSGSTNLTNVIRKCVNKGEIIAGKDGNNVPASDLDIGGIVGANWFNIENCKNEAPITSYIQKCGGIAGYNSGDISYCENSGNITNNYVFQSGKGGTDTGGIVGSNGGNVKNSFNSGSVSGDNNSVYIGGIAGFVGSGSTENCYNAADTAIKGGQNIGGIVGGTTVASNSIIDCYNKGNISCYNNSCGGIVGYWMSNIENCYNVGIVKTSSNSSDKIGGIVGRLNNNDKTKLKKCYYLALEGSAEHACGTDSSMDDETKKSDSEMKVLAEELGDAFENCTNDYPKLKWE